MTEKSNERIVSIIGIILTLCGSLVFVMEKQIDSLDQKIVVQVSALELEIERMREWINKVSSRGLLESKETGRHRGDISALKNQVDRLSKIVNELKHQNVIIERRNP